MENKQKNNMSSKRTYVATFWRGNPQLKNGGYYTTKEFQAMSHKAAERQAERYTKDMVYGGFNPTVVEKFDNKTDADSYAALMCRAKQRRYIVLEQVTEWDGTPQENARP